MNFSVSTTEGVFQPAAEEWVLVFRYTGDFLPVSATELAALSALQGQFQRNGCAILCLSGDSLPVHLAFLENLSRHAGGPVTLPLGTAPCHGKTLQLWDPAGQLRAEFCYPDTVGVNFTEALRTLLALQSGKTTPCGWVPEGETLALPPATRKELCHYVAEQEKAGHICVDWYVCYENPTAESPMQAKKRMER